MRTSWLALATMLVAVPLAAQQAAPTPEWGPGPPFFPAGARFAVAQGDPSADGIYAVRLEMPAGYTIAPHWHPEDEHITVLSGSLVVGMGDSVDVAGGMKLGAGGFITAPAKAHHFAVAQEKTVVQVHGKGPFAITYVRAKDDPRNQKPTP